MDRITNDATTLLRQAPMTAKTYLIEAIKAIDQALGDGYAEKHPALVSAFIQTCAMDFATAVLASVAQDIGELVRRD